MFRIFSLILLFVPLAAGLVLALGEKIDRKGKSILFCAALLAEAAGCACLLGCGEEVFPLFSMTETLTVALRMDSISKIFLVILTGGFLLSGFYATKYLEHETKEHSFYAFFLFSEMALVGMDLSSNLITMYLFFEMATLLSIPLVLFDRTKESIQAALKYLFYSIAGAFLGLLAIFVLSRYCTTLDFTAGGTLDAVKAAGHETLILIVTLLGIIGFGAKAGMYPLHGWLPVAHPVAPAPASAVLSGVITKAGVLAILRLLYFIIGPSFIRGTWVQTVLVSLSLLTVFMGSMMAYRQDVFKKRLAYSSVSQISYVLVGLFLMTAESVQGGLLQVLFHACVKICLFLVAGSVIHNAGKTKVSELTGIGKTMPCTTWAFTIASLSLIGIPPAAGFVSKWYLAGGALASGLPVLNWLAPVILLVSALLTAAYLLPITIRGFFPGKDYVQEKRIREGGVQMLLPIILLAALSLLMGIFSGPLTDWIGMVSKTLF